MCHLPALLSLRGSSGGCGGDDAAPGEALVRYVLHQLEPGWWFGIPFLGLLFIDWNRPVLGFVLHGSWRTTERLLRSMLMKSIEGTDVVGFRRCLEVTRQRRQRFARAFIDLHAHAGVLTHGASKKVSSLRCNLDVVLVDERELWAPAKTATGRLLQGPRCNFYFLQGCVCKAADVIFTMNK